MKVQDIMTEPALTCTPETSLAVVARLMRETDYGTLAVVDSRGTLVGIITDRDVCLAVAGTNRNAVSVAVHEAMTEKVWSARLDDDVHNVLATMKQHRVRRVPVCDDSGRLKGIVSIEDVVVRGLEGGGVNPNDIVAALRAMYVRTPMVVESAVAENGYTPG